MIDFKNIKGRSEREKILEGRILEKENTIRILRNEIIILKGDLELCRRKKNWKDAQRH